MSYTYLIGWSKLNKYYYGVRFRKGCNPNELWKSYFTSSKYVKSFRELNGEPDIIEIRKKFNDQNRARMWEQKVLQRIKAVYKDEWLNKSDQISIPSLRGNLNPMSREDVKEKHKQKLLTNEYRNNMRKIVTGRIHSEETKKKMSKSAILRGVGLWNKDKPKKEETKKKMSENASKRERLLCDKCNQGYTKPNFEKHYNSCKGEKKNQYKKCEDGIIRRVAHVLY
jgi:hypothetical protein